jgi:hypothetical protein
MGQSGKGGSAGSGGSGGAASGGSDGGAPDATGGTGNAPGGAGETSTGGSSETGGSTSTGGSGGGAGTGGSTATGGTGGDSTTGGTSQGGMFGSAGDGTGGMGLAGGATSGGTGGLAPTAGTTGAAGSGGSDPGTGGGAGMAGMAGKGGGCMPTEPEDEICDGVDNDCKGGVDNGNVCPSDCVGGVFGKHTYLLCHGDWQYTRQEARAECNARGDELGLTLELVRVESEAENDFLMELITLIDDGHPIWMGAGDGTMTGSEGEGSWVWGPSDYALVFYEDGEVVGDLFANWGEDQPDDGGFSSAMSEDCAVFAPAFDYRWDDRVCSDATEMYLCEQLDD